MVQGKASYNSRYDRDGATKTINADAANSAQIDVSGPAPGIMIDLAFAGTIGTAKGSAGKVDMQNEVYLNFDFTPGGSMWEGSPMLGDVVYQAILRNAVLLTAEIDVNTTGAVTQTACLFLPLPIPSGVKCTVTAKITRSFAVAAGGSTVMTGIPTITFNAWGAMQDGENGAPAMPKGKYFTNTNTAIGANSSNDLKAQKAVLSEFTAPKRTAISIYMDAGSISLVTITHRSKNYLNAMNNRGVWLLNRMRGGYYVAPGSEPSDGWAFLVQPHSSADELTLQVSNGSTAMTVARVSQFVQESQAAKA